MSNYDALYIWDDAEAGGRNRYVLFRHAFTLEVAPATGSLHLFADTRYRLLLNGVTLGHGPARFAVDGPEYDTYDLAPYLHAGDNVIAVLVNSYGVETFHSERSIGGLIAWGTVTDAAGQCVPLASDAPWRVLESPGHHPDTTTLSFALNPGEYLDARAMPTGWELPEFDDSAWAYAVPVAEQQHWGALAPRSIPPLNESAVPAPKCLGVWSALPVADEDVYSFFAIDTGWSRAQSAQMGAFTYLYSPVDQEITFGGWWGKYLVNGVEIPPKPRPDIPLRQDFTVDLRQGWNSLLILEGQPNDCWELYLRFPKAAGILLSTERQADSPHTFLLGGPWRGELARQAAALALTEADALPGPLLPWHPWPRSGTAHSAYLERSWAKMSPLAHDATGAEPGARVMVYDFGGEELGRPLLDFTASAGTRIDLAYLERVHADGSAVRDDMTLVNMAERYVAREGRQRWQTFHPRGLRYLEITVHDHPEAFALHHLGLTRAEYPASHRGAFSCSDPQLTAIWQAGVDTLQACMEDSYLDCPRRERGVYTGDIYVQFFTTMAAFGDTALVRRNLRQMFQRNHRAGLERGGHDYQSLVIMLLCQYYARTGDLPFVREMQAGLNTMLAAFARSGQTASGLLDWETISPYIDLSAMERKGVSCALNAFYQQAFADGARLLRVLGDNAGAEQAQGQADVLAARIRATFWDERRGVFLDRPVQDAEASTPSVCGNTLPLLFDIADARQAARVAPYLAHAVLHNFIVPEPAAPEDVRVNAYFAFYTLEVLYSHGYIEEAEVFMRACWGRMAEPGAWTLWEYFYDNASRCHAWASAPTYYLTTQVLGVTFPEPGNPNRVLLAPHPGSLHWAKGVYPHPAGDITVAWTYDGEHLEVQWTAPEGVEVGRVKSEE